MALWISIFSFVIASLSLGWNIYRDVILKPKLKVNFSVSNVIGEGITNPVRYVFITGTNFGPGEINCQMIRGRDATFWKRITGKNEFFVVIHDYVNPLSGQLPRKLAVGEKIDLPLLYDESDKCILKKNFTHIGISDSFGRVHYAPSKDIKKAKEQYAKDFAKN